MTIFTYKKIYKAYLDCRRNKRNTENALKFELDLENNLAGLLSELKSRLYRPGRSICFVVEKPQPREIFAADFRDRIVHHLLVGEVLAESEKRFFRNSFACRRGKGTHKAVKFLKKCIRNASGNSKEEIFFLQLDIKSFFVSIRHDVLWLAGKIIFYQPAKNCQIRGNKSLLGLIPPHKSLFNAPEKTGLPIGNYTSQFFAGLYLNRLDYFIKQKLRQKWYVRYVDDFIVLGESAEKLASLVVGINGFLKENLLVELNLNKSVLKSVSAGIDFLGYFHKTGLHSGPPAGGGKLPGKNLPPAVAFQ